ncbi:hypothetical protein HA402_011769 [Bradysia odoriphaga]|nr:hypothetical protein HA402_011769 [Bradysia odoriphaga]
MFSFSVKICFTIALILFVCVINSWAQDEFTFTDQPMAIPDVGATDSPQYYADANPMTDIEGSDIPEDLLLR